MEVLREEVIGFLTAGNGDGYGNGYGYGNGDGDGDGYGYGNGYGDGYGNGYGDGNGNGYGSGNGIKTINGLTVYKIDGIPTIITHIRNNIAKGFILEKNVYMRPCYVVKHNSNVFAHGETLKKAREALESKLFKDMDVCERISMFKKRFKLSVKYPASDFYDWHHKLTGSCEMGRNNFCENHEIDIKNYEMTVEEFIALTKDEFGGSVIRQLAQEIGIRVEKQEANHAHD